MTRIWTAGDCLPAMDAANKSGDVESLRILDDHYIHADHCGGYDVLAWPCPTAAKVLDRMFGGDA